MKSRIYNTTYVTDIFDLGEPIRYEESFKDGFREAYRLARYAYNHNKNLELFIATDGTQSLRISALPKLGILLSSCSNVVWSQEV